MILKNDEILSKCLKVGTDIQLSEKLYIYKQISEGTVVTLGNPLEPIDMIQNGDSNFNNTSKGIFSEQFHNFMGNIIEASMHVSKDASGKLLTRNSTEKQNKNVKYHLNNYEDKKFKLSDFQEFLYYFQYKEMYIKAVDKTCKIITLKKLDNLNFEKEINYNDIITKNFSKRLASLKEFQAKGNQNSNFNNEKQIFSNENYYYLKNLNDEGSNYQDLKILSKNSDFSPIRYILCSRNYKSFTSNEICRTINYCHKEINFENNINSSKNIFQKNSSNAKKIMHKENPFLTKKFENYHEEIDQP